MVASGYFTVSNLSLWKEAIINLKQMIFNVGVIYAYNMSSNDL